ncbi:hypothetical protein PR048_025564 [Dryococelus australis]|uniref:Uncharacterized protein n=1 Tax=Dryococelus australis TaxID=614101 RepID=A0ABQ9GRQ2_9NEOP|nr:hypothetical protein PR048_025564 [Dryococelus australis]
MLIKTVLVLDNAPRAKCERHPGIDCFFVPPHLSNTSRDATEENYFPIKLELENIEPLDVLKSINTKDVHYMIRY